MSSARGAPGQAARRGVPRRAGVEFSSVATSGTIVIGYGHRHTRPLGGQLYFLGPLACAATVVFVAARAFRWAKDRFARYFSERRVAGPT